MEKEKMKKLMLASEDFELIKKCNKLLELTGDDLEDYLNNNDVPFDSTYEEVRLELDDYFLELCTFSGDTISSAFWGEARLIDKDGNLLFFSEPLSDFEEFYVEHDEKEYGVTFFLDIENSCYYLEEEFINC